MKTSFHQTAVAFREKSYGKTTALLNSRGFRPVGKRDKAKQMEIERAFITSTQEDKSDSSNSLPADSYSSKSGGGDGKA